MAETRSLAERDQRFIWHPYTQEQTAPPPIPILHGEGATLTADDGRVYLDMISSWWVTGHGHAHPHIAEAVAQQARRLEQVIFAGFTHPKAVELAERLIARLPDGFAKLFFSDNGSTAVEVALKMALQYWHNQGIQRTRLAAFEGGYHGDTVGAMSAGRASGFFDMFAPMLFEVDVLPFPNTWLDDEAVEEKENAALAALDRYLDQPERGGACAAVLLEPLVQGAEGMRMCRPEFVQGVAQRLRAAGVLFIFDEVMTGFGRTGTLFACEKARVTPDILCLSKGLTGGFLPLSVTVCHAPLYEAFLGESFSKALAHGHSFTANPLGCAAAVASLELFEQPEVWEGIRRIEAVHRTWIERMRRHPNVSGLRVTGTIAAFEVAARQSGYHSEVAPILKRYFLERGLLIRPLGNTLYLLPPFCTTEAQLNHAWATIDQAVQTLVG
jgi:adenosylmethionine-8-amino-7-oxononanoate aminotransferase